MVNRATRLRWRRRFRRRRRQVEDMGLQAEQGLERHFFRRLTKVAGIRRFIFTWIALMLLLCGVLVAQIQNLPSLYKVPTPAPGGIYAEGMLGTFTNANPIFAVSPVDRSVSRLIFSSLLSYDQSGGLVGDLADTWTVDKRGTTYTVVLKDNLKWHDGKPLTAQDVVFTYKAIQNPDARSPFERSWRGIKVAMIDPKTITFTLPNILSPFPHSLTNGIVPRHLLEGVPMPQLRSVSFNTSGLVGSGPFQLGGIDVTGDAPETREQQVGFVPFDGYHSGRPKLNSFAIRTFRDRDRMIKSFEQGGINALAGLDEVPESLAGQEGMQTLDIPLDSQVNIFLKNSHPLLSDVELRRALVTGTDTAELINGLNYGAIPSDEPLLKHHIGYNVRKAQLDFNREKAKQMLSKAGWKVGPDGIRTKKKQRLNLSLYTQDSSEYAKIAHMLEQQWKELGVELTLLIQPEEQLQIALGQHTYDVLLYGISLGPDPDVFPFWHSSQARAGSSSWLNFSEYRSSDADTALEAGRTRFVRAIRSVKYQGFLEAWRNDAPAIALYQPRYLYITKSKVFNLQPTHMTNGVDRFADVENWMIRQELAETNP